MPTQDPRARCHPQTVTESEHSLIDQPAEGTALAEAAIRRQHASDKADVLATAATERSDRAREQQQRTNKFVYDMWRSLE